VPSEKRARQRAARDAKLAARAKVQKRRKFLRNGVIIAVVAAAAIGISLYFTSQHSTPSATATTTTTSATSTTAPTSTTSVPGTTTTGASSGDATAQLAATSLAVKNGCPASPTTRVNTLSWSNPPPMTIDPTKTYTANVVTTAGDFTIDLDAQQAPTTVNSFVFLAKQGFFHCVIFHRVIPGFMDQTGDPTGTGSGGPGYKFANENVPKAYVTGDVAMANSGGTDSNGSQFFLVVPGGATQLNSDLGQGDGYSVFGTVSSGMSVVNSINAQGNPSPSAGGVPPLVIQRILSVTIAES
jgi:cyclophilin family peptidyl-prolyl cis-trans isomerase